MRAAVVIALLLAALPAHAQSALDWTGFALLRAGRHAEPSAQVQVGIDWRPSPLLGAHLHLLARNDEEHSRRGRVGVVQAWVEQSFQRGEHRVHLTEGAFFLPTSRENVDELWESPYSITSSALNSWIGEEFRPIGIDAMYTLRRSWSVGATLFAGNDTFGAIPAERGWRLSDRWTLLGEHVAVDPEYGTSVSGENDHRLGWSARARWTNDAALVQLTHIDNRADPFVERGDLLNWRTRFDVASAELRSGDWIFLTEYGWGRTQVLEFPSDLHAAYALVSRRLGRARATLRVDDFASEHGRGRAVTAACFFTPLPKLRAGVEVIGGGAQRRALIELRYTLR